MDQYYRLYEVKDHLYTIQLSDELIVDLKQGVVKARDIIEYLIQDERVSTKFTIEKSSLANLLVDGNRVVGAYIDTETNVVHLKY